MKEILSWQKKLDLKLLQKRIAKDVSSKDALKDVIPFAWNLNSKVIVMDKRCSENDD